MLDRLARFLVLRGLGLAKGLRADLHQRAFRCALCMKWQRVDEWMVTIPQNSSGAGFGACLHCARKLSSDDVQHRKTAGDVEDAEFDRRAPNLVRPHVYADSDGAEWRCVVRQLQARSDDETDGCPTPQDRFGAGDFTNRPASEWLDFLRARYGFPESVAAAEQAIADPMTANEAEVDDYLARVSPPGGAR